MKLQDLKEEVIVKQMFSEINKRVDDAVGFLDPAHLIKQLEVKKQTDAIYCLMENFLKGLKNFVGDFLKELLGKLVNAPLCLAEKFIEIGRAHV